MDFVRGNFLQNPYFSWTVAYKTEWVYTFKSDFLFYKTNEFY